jgi:hypothetical protein
MDTSTQFRLDLVEDAIEANADDPARQAKLVAYKASILGNGDTGRPSRDVGELRQPPRGTGGTKATSGQPAASATGPQRGFIKKLVAERVTENAPWHFQNLLVKFAGETLSKRDASELIDWLNEQPVRATAPSRRPASEGQLRMVNARRTQKGLRPLAEGELFMDEVDEELAIIAAMPDDSVSARVNAAQADLEAGMYKVGDKIYKVYKAVHGSGKMCAKELVVLPAEGRDEPEATFDYRGLAERFVTAADRMSLEDAKAFGAIYGVCCVCAATLTDETSIAEGIGPVCSKRFS